jgi:hypothetical protein
MDIGRAVGRLLTTGRGFYDKECKIIRTSGSIETVFAGFTHTELNKDSPNPESLNPWQGHFVPPEVRRERHRNARDLATLQTAYEWCRLVREAARVERDGLLLAMFVKAGGNPHPVNTPCSPHPPGPMPIVVTITEVVIIDARDGGNEPGEIQLAAVLYDSPNDFHRSVHVSNRTGRMSLRGGQRVPAEQLPGPLKICVGDGRGATFTLHAWDNDDPLNDEYGLDFDREGDADELLYGFQVRLGAELPTGVQIANSPHLSIRYMVTRTASGEATLPCPPPLVR